MACPFKKCNKVSFYSNAKRAERNSNTRMEFIDLVFFVNLFKSYALNYLTEKKEIQKKICNYSFASVECCSNKNQKFWKIIWVWRIFMLYYMSYTAKNEVTSWFVWDWCMEPPSIVKIPKRWATFGVYL